MVQSIFVILKEGFEFLDFTESFPKVIRITDGVTGSFFNYYPTFLFSLLNLNNKNEDKS